MPVESPFFYYSVALVWIISTACTPIGTKYVSGSFDHISTTFMSYISRAIPFIVTYFILSSTSVIKPIDLFSPDNLMLSSMELFRSITSILAFILLPSSIAQSIYFTFPVMMLWFNHILIGIPVEINTIISGLLGLVGVMVVSWAGGSGASGGGFTTVYVVGIILALLAAVFQAYEVVYLKKKDLESRGGVPQVINIVPQMAGFFTFGAIIATVLYAVYIMTTPYHSAFRINISSGIIPVVSIILALGLTSFLPTLTHFVSLQGINANLVALLPYTIVAVTVLVEWMFEGVELDWLKIGGIGLISAGGLMSLYGLGWSGRPT